MKATVVSSILQFTVAPPTVAGPSHSVIEALDVVAGRGSQAHIGRVPTFLTNNATRFIMC